MLVFLVLKRKLLSVRFMMKNRLKWYIWQGESTLQGVPESVGDRYVGYEVICEVALERESDQVAWVESV